jgi:hypothetical protein
MKALTRNVLLAVTLLTLGVCLLVTSGCGTTAQTDAQTGIVATDVTVRTVMTGWGAYVSLKHPGVVAEGKVYTAFNQVKQGELGVIAAARAIGTNTDLTLLEAATLSYTSSKSNLFNIIGSITNAP